MGTAAGNKYFVNGVNKENQMETFNQKESLWS